MAKEKKPAAEKIQYNFKIDIEYMKKIKVYCAQNNLRINKMILTAIEKTYNL